MTAQDRKSILRFLQALRTPVQGGESLGAGQTEVLRQDGKKVMNSKKAQAQSSEELAVKLRESVLNRLTYTIGKDPSAANVRDWFLATAFAVRDCIVDRWIAGLENGVNQRHVYYMSLEFLIGRLLMDSLNNLGITGEMRAALEGLDVDLDALRDLEADAALGNGGLGRLAACFMESMATLGIPAHGYGIRYDFGLFRQGIRDGWQHEYPEEWLEFGNPWEFPRPEINYPVGFGGQVEAVMPGAVAQIWSPSEIVEAVAYDTPVVGWRGKSVNTLRLWHSRPADPLRLDVFNAGDYVGAQDAQVRAAAISKVLYPSDSTPAGQELRLRQEYFFASASLQDLVRRHYKQHGDITRIADKVAIQLNDTHPAIAIAEMMRLLVDVYGLPWEQAWSITQATFSYTNHTLLPEALESWPVSLIERLLPRHMQIIYLINALHLDKLRAAGHSEQLLSSVSLISEYDGRRVRMGNLAFLASNKVNGVSQLHTDLIKESLFHDFHSLYPERIVNKTNGITFRRWLFEANPGLTSLITEAIGPEFMDNTEALSRLARFAGDSGFQKRYARVRLANKEALARLINDRLSIKVDPQAVFDVHIKRIHEYKRQLLNVLHTIALYNEMRAHPTRDFVPHVKIFAGKAAASYHMAKLIIKLIHDVGRVVNNDPAVRGMLKVIFLPNYNVSLAEEIIPASDVSEQISTAGMEASGTGNMKFALNGALTIGTLDGANVEIREHVGADNIFIFGLTAAEVHERRATKGIDAREIIAASPKLREVLDEIATGVFSPDDPGRYNQLVDILTYHDHFMVTADFESYCDMQKTLAARWRDRKSWWRSSILNTASMAWFSSDRAIRQYAEEIWCPPAAIE